MTPTSTNEHSERQTIAQLDWRTIAASFHLARASEVLALRRLERHQAVKGALRWLEAPDAPLVLLFVSHRWETLEQPDPTGRQLRAFQKALRELLVAVEAMLVPREERLRLVPSLAREGALQAEELARRLLDSGPFGTGTAGVGGRAAKDAVRAMFAASGADRCAFRAALADRIGVWVDYLCMPQRPLVPDEEPEFRRALKSLDALVASSTVVALRQPADDYSVRGWCVSEHFLGSARSFARALFIDTTRMEEGAEVAMPGPPPTSADRMASEVMSESYAADLAAFRDACASWLSFPGTFADATPPSAWSEYRQLQGSGFLDVERDPNPSRRAVEVVRELETELVARWLMSAAPETVDLEERVRGVLARIGLRCSDPSDLAYLGFLLAANGWIEAFRPLLRACIARYLDGRPTSIRVTLEPPGAEVRELLGRVRPSSADTWRSRLSSGSGHAGGERAVVDRVRTLLERNPLRFAFAGT